MVNIQKLAMKGCCMTLIHMAYQTMCRWTGYGFLPFFFQTGASLSQTGYYLHD